MKTIYTIGHSTRSIDEFISMLQLFDIRLVADIRSMPGSRKFPHFNQEALENSLSNFNISYKHFPGLGGRRKMTKDSTNIRWRNESFRGYADYMQTDEFINAIVELETLALQKTTAYMCAETLWWRCHRSLVSDILKLRDWDVVHIIGTGKVEQHKYTSPARIEAGKLYYSD